MKWDFMCCVNIEISFGSYIVYGIQCVVFCVGIELINVFMICVVFFCLMVIFVSLVVVVFKGVCEMVVKNKMMDSDKFFDFCNGWFMVFKGILFCFIFIGFLFMVIMCLWEFIQNDLVVLMVLVVFFLIGMMIMFCWVVFKVIMIVCCFIVMYNNLVYIFFLDFQVFNKWGFFYVQFRVFVYYFILFYFGYLGFKVMFIVFVQYLGIVQVVGFFIIEVGVLIVVSVFCLWMDKSINFFNIVICVINFVNLIFLMIFIEVFNQFRFVIGVVGVVLWIVNVFFVLVLLLMFIVIIVIVIFCDNLDGCYIYMVDDRILFMKFQMYFMMIIELDVFVVIVCGGKEGFNKGMDLDDDVEFIILDLFWCQIERFGVFFVYFNQSFGVYFNNSFGVYFNQSFGVQLNYNNQGYGNCF